MVRSRRRARNNPYTSGTVELQCRKLRTLGRFRLFQSILIAVMGVYLIWSGLRPSPDRKFVIAGIVALFYAGFIYFLSVRYRRDILELEDEMSEQSAGQDVMSQQGRNETDAVLSNESGNAPGKLETAGTKRS